MLNTLPTGEEEKKKKSKTLRCTIDLNSVVTSETVGLDFVLERRRRGGPAAIAQVFSQVKCTDVRVCACFVHVRPVDLENTNKEGAKPV